MATYFKLENVDGVVKSVRYEVSPKNGKHFTYKELQDFVKYEGYDLIQIVPLPDGRSLVVNDEGKYINLPKNELATELWKEQYPIAEFPVNNDELIVGNALVVEENELKRT